MDEWEAEWGGGIQAVGGLGEEGLVGGGEADKVVGRVKLNISFC